MRNLLAAYAPTTGAPCQLNVQQVVVLVLTLLSSPCSLRFLQRRHHTRGPLLAPCCAIIGEADASTAKRTLRAGSLVLKMDCLAPLRPLFFFPR